MILLVVSVSVSALVIVVLTLRPAADVAKRAAMSLSALGFKRSYGIGGVFLLASAFIAGQPEIFGVDTDSWEWILIAWFLKDKMQAIILIALGLPLVATVISEAAFLLVRALVESEVNPFSFMPIRIEQIV